MQLVDFEENYIRITSPSTELERENLTPLKQDPVIESLNEAVRLKSTAPQSISINSISSCKG
jgi:hypothetical protein